MTVLALALSQELGSKKIKTLTREGGRKMMKGTAMMIGGSQNEVRS